MINYVPLTFITCQLFAGTGYAAGDVRYYTIECPVWTPQPWA